MLFSAKLVAITQGYRIKIYIHFSGIHKLTGDTHSVLIARTKFSSQATEKIIIFPTNVIVRGRRWLEKTYLR